MSHQCYVCQTEKGLDECVGCHQLVCKTHAGHVKQYISIDGRKGRGCQKCIKELEDSIKRTAESVSQQLEQTADRIVADNLVKVQETLTQLTQEITKAISHQRVEVSSDAEKIIQALSKTIQLSFVYLALIIVFGLAGIKWLMG